MPPTPKKTKPTPQARKVSAKKVKAPPEPSSEPDKADWREYKLNKISINGFKSLQQIDDFELKSLNVLVGGNGAGKSNFLDFFEMLAAMIGNRNLQYYVAMKGGADNLLFHGGKQTSSMRARLDFSDADKTIDYAFRLEQNEENHFIFTKEEGELSHESGDGANWYMSEHGYKEAQLRYAQKILEKIPRKFLEYCRIYQFNDTSATSQLKTEADIEDKVFLRGDGGNLAAVLHDLRENHTRAYNDIEGFIGRVLPVFDGFELTPLYEKVVLRWRQKKNNAKLFGPNLTSDGALRMMALITLLCMPKERIPNLVLLDEPELGVHPYATGLIAALIKRLSISKQIIVATQSPKLLNDFKINDIVVTAISKDGATSFRRLKTAEYKIWLEDYRLGDIWMANIFGGNPE